MAIENLLDILFPKFSHYIYWKFYYNRSQMTIALKSNTKKSHLLNKKCFNATTLSSSFMQFLASNLLGFFRISEIHSLNRYKSTRF